MAVRPNENVHVGTNLVLQEELRLRIDLVPAGLLQHRQLLQLLQALRVLEGLQAAQHLQVVAENASQSAQGC